MRCPYVMIIVGFLSSSLILSAQAPRHKEYPKRETPRPHDPNLIVELFAAAPEIVHPIAVDFDSRGRLLVIESHTHFAPAGYPGPKFDRIRMIEDTDGDGKADRFTTFFEGTKHTMDLAVHPDGSVYLATRNEILRLRDTQGTGKADEKTRVVFLDTRGDYPHNGLSGLCFDSRGNLIFGMGENLGAAYKLIGADGITISGEGDGGHIFWCSAEGKNLRRIAKGFWNPFGIGRDIYGRLIAVDNDPDEMPPCRMVHVVEGGDYGFQFRYGRSGKHPFQSWHGQLPGTLPMMSGVGEAPCEVLSYESDGLPRNYLGQLLVTSWADHRVERYNMKNLGASFKAERLPFIQGGKDFRPVGLATAPDGSLFVSDWVLSNYSLHQQGALWHIRWREAKKMPRPENPRQALFSLHRSLRETAAKKLAQDKSNLPFLRQNIRHEDVRIRASVLTALMDVGDRQVDLKSVAETDSEIGMRELAVRGMTLRRENVRRFLDAQHPGTVRVEAIRSLVDGEDETRILELLTENDPFLRHAAVQQLKRHPLLLLTMQPEKLQDVRQRIGYLLAQRGSPRREKTFSLKPFLQDPSEEVRFLAVKWIADEPLKDYRPMVVEALKDPGLSVRMYLAYATALARLDHQEVSETRLADYFVQRLVDDATTPELRGQLLRQVPSSHPKLTLAALGKLLTHQDESLRMETVRALTEHPNPKKSEALLNVLRNPKQTLTLRAHALIGLTERAQELAGELIEIGQQAKSPLREEALRVLIGVKLNEQQRKELREVGSVHQETAPLVARLLGNPYYPDRPSVKNLDDWLKRLEGPADASAGGRVFAHPKLGGCYRCHRSEGRGKQIGPDLSSIGQTDRRHLLESILQPSNTVAPHYQTWHLEMSDGKIRTGMLVHTHLDEYTYVDTKGEAFKVNTRDVADMRPLPVSIMPEGLVELMTDQEIRDLLAYLESRK